MITAYVRRALVRAKFQRLEDGTYCATVRGLHGVIAVGRTLAACRASLGEVVEEWVLVRVARGLSVPKLDGLTVRVKRAG
jgi:predicted RNase H-like HicB family nuclease